MSIWSIPEYYRLNYPTISIDLFREMASESEKYLAETTKTAESITNKVQFLIPITIGLITSVFGYLISTDGRLEFKIASCAAIPLLFVALYFLWQANSRYAISVIGSPPSLLFHEHFVVDVHVQETQEKLFLINKCIDYDIRIKGNDASNLRRSSNLNLGILLISLFPACLIIGGLGSIFYNFLTPNL